MSIPKGAGRRFAVGLYLVRIYWARVALAALIFGAGVALGERKGRQPAAVPVAHASRGAEEALAARLTPIEREVVEMYAERDEDEVLPKICWPHPLEVEPPPREPEDSKVIPTPEPAPEVFEDPGIWRPDGPLPAEAYEEKPAAESSPSENLPERWQAFMDRLDAVAEAVDGAGRRLGHVAPRSCPSPLRDSKRRWH